MLFPERGGEGGMHFVLATSSFSNRVVTSVRKIRFVEGRRLGLNPTH